MKEPQTTVSKPRILHSRLAAVVTSLRRGETIAVLDGILHPDRVHEIPDWPDFYAAHGRCEAVVQTGDYTVHADTTFIAGYPNMDVPVDLLLGRNDASEYSG